MKRASESKSSDKTSKVKKRSRCRNPMQPLETSLVDAAPGILLRVVHPYAYTFSTHAKGRWIGNSLLSVYSQEFGSYPTEYYETAIRQGRIRVSDRVVDTSYAIQERDLLQHTVHRHEPAVGVNASGVVTVVANTADFLVVDKPSTLPTHPSGAYHENSLVPLLNRQSILDDSIESLHPLYRLDRLTSGLVLLAKNKRVAKKWGKVIKRRDGCQKLYLARVKGHFMKDTKLALPRLNAKRLPVHGEWAPAETGQPLDDNTAQLVVNEYGASRQRNVLGYWVSDFYGQAIDGDDASTAAHGQSFSVDECLDAFEGNPQDAPIFQTARWFHLSCPVRVANKQIGVCESGTFDDLDEAMYLQTVKAAHTAFLLLRYDSDSNSSIIVCRPYTGRTHQIRVHLRHVCHPIANDPNYGGDMWYDNPRGQAACAAARSRLSVEQGSSNAPLVSTDTPATSDEVALLQHAQQDADESLDSFIQRTCVWCARGTGSVERSMDEFLVRSPGIWLHALQYQARADDGATFSFRTSAPSWA